MAAVDEAVFSAVNGLAGRSGTLDRALTFWASEGPMLLIAATAVAWVMLSSDRKDGKPRLLALSSVVAAILAIGVSQLIGDVWFRDRPYGLDNIHLLVAKSADPSFPSDHTVGAFALAAPFLTDARTRAFGLSMLSGACFMGFSRVFVGAHYPGDVLGGAVVGIAVGLVVTRLFMILTAHTSTTRRVIVPLDDLTERARKRLPWSSTRSEG